MSPKGCNRGTIYCVERKRGPVDRGIMTDGVREMFVRYVVKFTVKRGDLKAVACWC